MENVIVNNDSVRLMLHFCSCEQRTLVSNLTAHISHDVKEKTDVSFIDSEKLHILKQILQAVYDVAAEDESTIVSTVDKHLENGINQGKSVASSTSHHLLSEVIRNVCLPLLLRLSPSTDTRNHVAKLLIRAVDLLITCIRIQNAHENDLKYVVKLCLVSLSTNLSNIDHFDDLSSDAKSDIGLAFTEDQSSLDVLTTLHLLTSLLSPSSQIQPKKNVNQVIIGQLIDVILLTIPHLEICHISKATRALVKLITVSENKNVKLKQFWKCVIDLHTFTCDESDHSTSSVRSLEKPYIMLCDLAGYLFPVMGVLPGEFQVCQDDTLWKLLQCGLWDRIAVTRKRCIYLLKRIIDMMQRTEMTLSDWSAEGHVPVFWWDPVHSTLLSRLWDDFILIMETLEEKQVHLIEPIFPRVHSLIRATETHNTNTDTCMLHSSWLVAVMQRAMRHQTQCIVRWAVVTLLSTDMTICPLLQQGQDQYLSNDFICCLRDIKLYSRQAGDSIGSEPRLGGYVTQFFLSCWTALQSATRRSKFFSRILCTIDSQTWSSIPLLFVVKGLARLPVSSLLDAHALHSIRNILNTNLTTMEAFLRAAIEHFLTDAMLNLIDTSSTGPCDVAVMLGILGREDSMRRGTSLWNRAVTWLKDVSTIGAHAQWSVTCLNDWTDKRVTEYLTSDVTKQVQGESSDAIDCGSFVRMLLLLADAGILGTQSSSGEDTRSQYDFPALVQILITIDTHAYMSKDKADRAILMWTLLHEELKDSHEDHVLVCVHSALLPCVEHIISYIKATVSGSIEEVAAVGEYLALYSRALCICVRQSQLNTLSLNSDLIKLPETCASILAMLHPHESQQTLSLVCQMRRLSAIMMIGSLCSTRADNQLSSTLTRYIEQLFLTQTSFAASFKKPNSENTSSVTQRAWGKLTGDFLTSHWNCLTVLVQQNHLTNQTAVAIVDAACEGLALGSGETTLVVMNCLTHVLPLLESIDDGEKTVKVLDRSWCRMQEERRKGNFFTKYEAWVALAYQPCVLTQSEDSCVSEAILKYTDLIFRMGEDRMDVVRAMIKPLVSCLAQVNMTRHVYKFIPVIVQAFIYGSIHKKHDRQWLDVCAYVESLGSNCTVNQLKPSMSSMNMDVRVLAVNFITGLSPNNNDDSNLAETILMALMQQHRTLMTQNVSWNFSNSLHHRLRHRVVQPILLLEAFVNQGNCQLVWDYIWDILAVEIQPSVRYVLEWISIRILIRFQHLRKHIWTLLFAFSEKRTTSLCSLLLIIAHLGVYLSTEAQSEYYKRAFPQILPWCMANHFNTRVHAQATLLKLWKQCEQLALTSITDQHAAILRNFLSFTHDNNNATRSVKKLMEHFFFFTFDCQRDFSIETIFHTLPKLSCLSDDEWIAPDVFLKSDSEWSNNSCFPPLLNSCDALKHCKPGPWRLKGQDSTPELPTHDKSSSEENTQSPSHLAQRSPDDNGQSSSRSNIQKKIMPWRGMFPEAGLNPSDMSESCPSSSGLVLVASLIDKAPNLGGLCRTSEIFGVSEFVVNSVSCFEDKLFQSLSVTADKWLPVREVKLDSLKDYLLEKQHDGYTLVGVEQTANSVLLTDYQFSTKTLLLLGNEKEGIPVDLIQFLDVCLEIPQQGIIRSLNVHVSGALLIWEYRRQQLVHQAH